MLAQLHGNVSTALSTLTLLALHQSSVSTASLTIVVTAFSSRVSSHTALSGMPPAPANSDVLGLLPSLYDFRNHLNALVALGKKKFPDDDAETARAKRIASQYSNRGDRPVLNLSWPLPFDL
jgi:hypothetical protein